MAANPGEVRRISSTGLTFSKNTVQSMEDIHRMLVMMFLTVTFAAA